MSIEVKVSLDTLELALEELEGCYVTFYEDEDIAEAITALRAAIASYSQAIEQKQEPNDLHIAYMSGLHRGKELAQRQPLTDEQIKAALSDMSALQMPFNKLIPAIARAIEAAHGIKGEA